MFAPTTLQMATYTSRSGANRPVMVVSSPAIYQTTIYGGVPTDVVDIALQVGLNDEGLPLFEGRVNGVRLSDTPIPGRCSPAL